MLKRNLNGGDLPLLLQEVFLSWMALAQHERIYIYHLGNNKILGGNTCMAIVLLNIIKEKLG